MAEKRMTSDRVPAAPRGKATKAFDLEDRLLEFAARMLRLVDHLPKSAPGKHVAAQLLRSGTSPLPNHGEAQAAESAKDFVHKMSICLKELRESDRWLKLVMRVPLIRPPSKVASLLAEPMSSFVSLWRAFELLKDVCAGKATNPTGVSILVFVRSWTLDVRRSP